jgi:hypothetical protein
MAAAPTTDPTDRAPVTGALFIGRLNERIREQDLQGRVGAYVHMAAVGENDRLSIT